MQANAACESQTVWVNAAHTHTHTHTHCRTPVPLRAKIIGVFVVFWRCWCASHAFSLHAQSGCQERGLNLRLEMGAVEIPGSGCLAPWNRILGRTEAMKREGEEQLPSPLYGFDAPLLTPQTHSAHARTHMCREGEKGGWGDCGGRGRERESKEGSIIRRTRFGAITQRQSGRQWPEHVFLTVTNSYSSTNPARAFTRCLLPACMCLYGWWHVCACICAHAVDQPVSDRQETQGNRKEERGGGGDKEGGAPHMAVKEGDWFSAPCYRGQQPLGPPNIPPVWHTNTISLSVPSKTGLSSIICPPPSLTWS